MIYGDYYFLEALARWEALVSRELLVASQITSTAPSDPAFEFERLDPAPALMFRIQRSESPAGGPWTTIAAKTGAGAWSGTAGVTEDAPAAGKVRVRVTEGPSVSRAFYRMQMLSAGGMDGFTLAEVPDSNVFSAYFNNGSGSGGDDNASTYNWTAAIGTGGVLDGTITGAPAQVGVSQGVTNSAGVPTISSQSTSGGFLYALPDTSAGVSLLHTVSLTSSATMQDNPQESWFHNGSASLAGLTVGDIARLSVYTRPATTATTMRFALLVGGNWVVSTTEFHQTDTAVYEQRTLGNLSAANAWYSSVFVSGSSLDADLSDNPTVTLNASDLVTGYGWYADTDAQSSMNSRVRIDSYQIAVSPAPPRGLQQLGGWQFRQSLHQNRSGRRS